MTIYSLPCKTLSRFAKIPRFFEARTSPETVDLLKTIRVENYKGFTYLIATNYTIAAVEQIGPTTEADDFCHLKLDEPVLRLIEESAAYDLSITVNCLPFACAATIQTPVGFILPDCCHWFKETPLNDWHSWSSPDAKANNGVMVWDSYHVELLMNTSPSGRVVFPQFIDAEKPVTLRDYSNEKWVGLFLPDVHPGERKPQPAKLPTWWKQ